MKYRDEKLPLIVIAGKEYGSGSSRDWAAKGTILLGVRAVLAESFERIHRSNLVGMGVLPLEFLPGESHMKSLGLTGLETFDIEGLADTFVPRRKVKVTARGRLGRKITSARPRESTLLSRSPTTSTAAFCSTSCAKCSEAGRSFGCRAKVKRSAMCSFHHQINT